MSDAREVTNQTTGSEKKEGTARIDYFRSSKSTRFIFRGCRASEGGEDRLCGGDGAEGGEARVNE